MGANTDRILFYTKGKQWTWNQQYLPYDEPYKARFKRTDPDGRRWTDDNLTAKGLSGGGYEYEYKDARSLWRVPLETMKRLDAEGRLHFTNRGGIRLKRYLDELPGYPLQVLWTDINAINSQATERQGYPTQKPLALYERIVQSILQARRPGTRPVLRMRHYPRRSRTARPPVGRHGHLGRSVRDRQETHGRQSAATG